MDSRTLRQFALNQQPHNASSAIDEWIEGFNEWQKHWESSTVLRPDIQAMDEIEGDPENLLRRIESGTHITRPEMCGNHGSFVRSGTRFGSWIAWNGQEHGYGSGWTGDAGCQGCREHHEAFLRERTFSKDFPVRQFDLRTPVRCHEHGNYILEVSVTEYTEERAKVFRLPRVDVRSARNSLLCPICEGDMEYESAIQSRLGLTNDEWARGGKAIIAAVEFAQGGVQ